jgi:hypothetical protein
VKFVRSNWYAIGLVPLVNVSTGTPGAGKNGPELFAAFVMSVSVNPSAGIVPLKETSPLPSQSAVMLVISNDVPVPVGVFVAVFVGVLVLVAVGVFVAVAVGVFVAVAVAVFVAVGVFVIVGDSIVTTQLKMPSTVSLVSSGSPFSSPTATC